MTTLFEIIRITLFTKYNLFLIIKNPSKKPSKNLKELGHFFD